ncbi:MAG TPA: patatin-like phospholipase family protein [Bryobacteraceae bacterium]|nr:patatin-like phospholipase family protein [Bryobacteraceae bacterium]
MTTALVLSAGGLYAAWEIGVWKALRTQLRPDIIVGASAGAWNGWAIAGGTTPEQLAEEWLDPLTARLMQFGLHGTGCLRPDALHAKARELASRFQPQIPFGLTVVEVPKLRVHLVRNGEIGWQHLAATCAIPCGFPPVRIDGKRYVDGGFMGALPLWAAEEMGATHAIALNVLTTVPFRILHRLLRRREPSKSFHVTTIEPSVPLGSVKDAVCWSRDRILRWIELGERDGNRAMSSITM